MEVEVKVCGEGCWNKKSNQKLCSTIRLRTNDTEQQVDVMSVPPTLQSKRTRKIREVTLYMFFNFFLNKAKK